MKLTIDRTDALVREIPFTRDGEIRVMLSAGSLRIVGTDDAVVRIRCDGPVDDVVRITQGEDELDIRAHDDPATLRIGPLTIGGRGSADLELHVPRASRLTVRTASADISAAGLTGDGRWASASGEIELALDGGAVRFETMSGDVSLTAAHIVTVEGKSVSGDVSLHAPAFAALRAGTTSGDLVVDGALSAGPHAIETISGDTRIVTPTGVRVETATVTGDVLVKGATAVDEGRRTFRIGDAAAELRWRSMSGDLTIVADPAPARPVAPVPPVHDAAPPAPSAPVAPPRAAPDIPDTRETPETPAVPPIPEPVVVAEAQASPNLVRPTLAPTPRAAAPAESGTSSGAAVPTAEPAGAPRADLTSAIEQRAALRRTRTERQEAARLEVLHAVERGELSIDDAATRLAALDEDNLGNGGAV